MNAHLDVAALRALAANATPGPWTWDWGDGSLPELRMEEYDGTDPTVLGAYVCKTCHSSGSKCLAPNHGNAAFIAAANPRTVLAVLDRLAAAEAFVAAVRADPYGCLDIIDALSAYDRLVAAEVKP